MSGIVGIYHLDGRPVDRESLQRMSAAIAHRGRDDCGMRFDGPIGMAHRMFHTTPESLFEKQPFMDEGSQLCLVMDGRVDNRDELKSALASEGLYLRAGADAEIVLSAYRAWGEDCASRIIGDFAFAIWDGRLQRLFCARDFMGVRPFLYHFDGRTFLWASELHAVLESPDVSRKPNEGMAGEYLASYIRSLTETLFQGVMRLPPAHYLIVDGGGIRFRRYWDFDPSKSVPYRTDEQYAEHFYELFREAVRSRMRSVGPVASDLSGGLDSSSVVGVAQELLRDGCVNGAGFETVSWVFPGRECDESLYINEMVSKWNLVSRKLTPKPASAETFIEQVNRYLDFPGYPNAHALDSLRSLARASGVYGCRVVLTGEGGDEWLTGMWRHYIDLLAQRKFGRVVRELYRDGGLRSLGECARECLRTCVWPVTPKLLQRLVRRCLNRPESPKWIDRRFAKRIGLADRLQQEAYTPPGASFAQREMYSALTDGFSAHAQEVGERNAAWSGLEIRHPLCDRRIVEFGLAIPEEQRRRGEVDKFILRNAIKESLPAAVLNRKDKAEFSNLFVEQMRAIGGVRLFDSMEIAGASGQPVWTNETEVRSMYVEMERFSETGFKGPVTYVWALWMIWGVELWRRAAFGTAPRA